MSSVTKITLRRNAIQDLARKEGISMRELAERLDVTPQAIYLLLDNRTRCSWRDLLKIAAMLKVEPTTVADIEIEQR